MKNDSGFWPCKLGCLMKTVESKKRKINFQFKGQAMLKFKRIPKNFLNLHIKLLLGKAHKGTHICAHTHIHTVGNRQDINKAHSRTYAFTSLHGRLSGATEELSKEGLMPRVRMFQVALFGTEIQPAAMRHWTRPQWGEF